MTFAFLSRLAARRSGGLHSGSALHANALAGPALAMMLACGEHTESIANDEAGGAAGSVEGGAGGGAGATGQPPHSAEDCALSYREGHGDLFVDFDGELSLRIRSSFSPGAAETLADPSAVCVIVPPASCALARSMGGAPASAEYAFLGAGAGEAFWLLPQAPREAIPWFGASTEAVPTGVYDDDTIDLVISTVDMPEGGNFATFSSGTFGAPSVIFATASGKLTHSFRTGAHLHFNWAFTVEGKYTLALAVAAEREGMPETSAPTFVRFLVQP